MARMKRRLSLSACPLAVLLLLSAPAPAQLAAPSDGEFVPEVRAQLTPRRSTVLSSELAGKISDLSVREGDSFSEGQRLVALDCDVHRARLDRAVAQDTAARKSLEVKNRLQALNSIGALEVETAAAERAVAEAELAMAREVVKRCAVTAPFAGRVAALEVKRWQFVAEGQKLLEIVDTADLEAEMLVPSRWLAWLKTGTVFEVQIEETGRRYPAKVSRVAPRIDPVSQSVKVFAAVTGGAGDLLPGMSGRALFAAPGN